jgi:uncharacterized protein
MRRDEFRQCPAFRSGSDEPIIRNRRTTNPNWTESSPGMDDADHALFPRFSAELVATALKDTPVVMVTGPRQCGKTTLVLDLVIGNHEFITMDDDTVLAAARSDPPGLVRALDRTTMDEVQRVPDLLRAIKKSVDDVAGPAGFC